MSQAKYNDIARKSRKDEKEENVCAMSSAGRNEEVREALSSIGQYLSDSVPPVLVAEPISILLNKPAQLMASEIMSWLSTQYREENKASVVHYLVHALIKLHYLGQLQLVPVETLTPYLESVQQLLIERCPPVHRTHLREGFARIGTHESSKATPINLLYGQRESGQTKSKSHAAFTPEKAGSRLAQPPDRPESDIQAPASSEVNEHREEAMPKFDSAASSNIQTNSELLSFQNNLKSLGMNSGEDHIFRELGRNLPGWMISTTDIGAAESHNPAVKAMVQYIHLAENRWDVGKRFQEMIQAAIDQFNTGSLVRAATMFDLALDASTYHRLNPSIAIEARQSMHESLDLNRLRDFANERNKHRLLRKVLNFFDEFAVDNMLNRLQTEERRDRRRLLLILITAHGSAARKAALQRLKEQIETVDAGSDWHFMRNLICLLADIPRSRDASPNEEMDLVAPLVTLSLPMPLVKEAIRLVGQIRCERSEHLLISTVDKLESEIFKIFSAGKDPASKISLLDRTVFALAHLRTPKSNERVIKHGMSRYDELGDTMARLTYLSGQDLTSDRESINTLVQFIKSKMPRKLLGVTIQKNEDLLLQTIKALSSTPDVVVRLALDVVAEQFPETKFGQAAANALKEFAASDKRGASSERILTGDMELFGLPDVLEKLSQSQAGGILMLKDAKGSQTGEFTLLAGRMQKCRAGRLEGMEAACQLFEKPTGGSFIFKGQSHFGAQARAEELKLPDMASIISEGKRRYDELQFARAIVPDLAQLRLKRSHPIPDGEGEDAKLVNQIRQKIEAGTSPEECEAVCSADSWRVRSLLARWVEAGILTVDQHPSQNPANISN
ncbi:MAG: DUF4388 domain-containing protein [Acidobacteria bacterium]|nr:DUF4388 domain-containing protein [Acidobacteriota bacterium]